MKPWNWWMAGLLLSAGCQPPPEPRELLAQAWAWQQQQASLCVDIEARLGLSEAKDSILTGQVAHDPSAAFSSVQTAQYCVWKDSNRSYFHADGQAEIRWKPWSPSKKTLGVLDPNWHLSDLLPAEHFGPFSLLRNSDWPITSLADTVVEGIRCWQFRWDFPPEADGEVAVGWALVSAEAPKLLGFGTQVSWEGQVNGYQVRYRNWRDATAVRARVDSLLARKILRRAVDPAERALLPVGAVAPGWEAPLEQLAGPGQGSRALVLDFWFRDCLPCRAGMKRLQRWQDRPASQGLTVIGLNPVDQPGERTQAHLASLGVKYPSIYHCGELAQAYGVSAFPTLYLLNASHQVVFRAVGEPSETQWQVLETRIDSLLHLPTGTALP